MGSASGKLTLHPVHDRTKQDTNDVVIHKTTDTVETASQLVNGDASVMNNVPAIDDVAEPISGKPAGEAQTEVIESVDAGPNGTVNVAEASDVHETEKKKPKNPLGWIKRRLSKKTSITKEATASQDETKPDEVADTASLQGDIEESKTPSLPEGQMNETAESLVNEVISSAVAAQKEPVATQLVTPVQQPEQSQVPEHELSRSVEEQVHSDASMLSEAVAENAVHETYQNQMPEEESVPVLDTNNTNVSMDDAATPAPTPAEDELQEAVFSKLAELDLTNGHPEQHLPTENGVGTESGEVMVNGE